jgi:diguanylate cyclase (GGDEF)-like protein
MKNSHVKAAGQTAERIRRAVMYHGFDCGEMKIRLTCSVGVHTMDVKDEHTAVDDLIDIVDKKRYKAKNSGRNRVVV